MDVLQEKAEFLLEPKIPALLRDEVNEDVRFSIETKRTLKGEKEGKLFPAWHRICAIMDRIDDLVYHINRMVVEPAQDRRGAFSFFDLLNHGAVLIDCVNEIARLYEIDLSTVDAEDNVFHNRGKDGKGSDKAYFEYLRSLCSVHPIETSRHRRYMDTEFECCPYVIWLDDYHREIQGGFSLKAQIYTNRMDASHYKTVYISLNEVRAYIQKRYNLLENTVIDGIHRFKERKKDEYRSSQMRTEEEFTDYIAYLQYLRATGEERYGDAFNPNLDTAIFFMRVSFSDQTNCRLLNKYQNALKYAIKFHHNCLQNMRSDGFENSGVTTEDSWNGALLLDHLIRLGEWSAETARYGYELEKRDELLTDSYYYALCQLEHAKPFLEKYITLDEAKEPADYYALTQLALYQASLEEKTLVNRNIPNESDYRIQCLTEDEWVRLHTPEEPSRQSAINMAEFMEILKKYGQ